MKNKIVRPYDLLLILGIGLFCIGGFVLKAEELKAISGILIGIGAGLFGMSLGRILQMRIEDKDPTYRHKMDIEKKDERNVTISDKAKAKAFDFMSVAFGILMLIYILIQANLLILLLVVAAYLLVHVVYFVYANKYSKEM